MQVKFKYAGTQFINLQNYDEFMAANSPESVARRTGIKVEDLKLPDQEAPLPQPVKAEVIAKLAHKDYLVDSRTPLIGYVTGAISSKLTKEYFEYLENSYKEILADKGYKIKDKGNVGYGIIYADVEWPNGYGQRITFANFNYFELDGRKWQYYNFQSIGNVLLNPSWPTKTLETLKEQKVTNAEEFEKKYKSHPKKLGKITGDLISIYRSPGAMYESYQKMSKVIGPYVNRRGILKINEIEKNIASVIKGATSDGLGLIAYWGDYAPSGQKEENFLKSATETAFRRAGASNFQFIRKWKKNSRSKEYTSTSTLIRPKLEKIDKIFSPVKGQNKMKEIEDFILFHPGGSIEEKKKDIDYQLIRYIEPGSNNRTQPNEIATDSIPGLLQKKEIHELIIRLEKAEKHYTQNISGLEKVLNEEVLTPFYWGPLFNAGMKHGVTGRNLRRSDSTEKSSFLGI